MKVVVAGILRRQDGLILLGLRGPKEKALPNYWCTPGGGVEETDANIDAALIREFREEVGINVTVSRAFTHVGERRCEKNGNVVMIARLVLPRDNGQPKPGDGIVAVRWFSRQEIIDNANTLTPFSYEALQAFLYA